MNITVNIGEILTKAWKIVWKFKVLWIFGIMAGCASGNRSSFNNGYSSGGGGGGNNGGEIPEPFRQFASHPLEVIQSFIGQYLAIIAVVVLLLCVLWFVFYSIGIMGKTGLIKGASKADAGAEKLTFGELWTESVPYFWRMFGLSLLIGLPFFILILIVVVVFLVGVLNFVANGGSDRGSVMGLLGALGIFIPSICCLSIIQIIAGLIAEQARNLIVLEDKGVFEALRRGWDLFKHNFLTIILVAIILGVLGFIVGFIMIIPLALILVPVFASVVVANFNSNTMMVPLIIGGLCFLAYLPVLLLLGGIEHSYIQSVWTLTYLRLTAPAPAAPPAVPETADAA
jgi:hypothetical protein